MIRKRTFDLEQRDTQSPLRLAENRVQNRKTRKRRAKPWSHPSINKYECGHDSFESMRTAQHSLLDLSTDDLEESSESLNKGTLQNSTRKSTIKPNTAVDDFYASCIHDEDFQVGDKYLMFDKDDFENDMLEDKENNRGAATIGNQDYGRYDTTDGNKSCHTNDNQRKNNDDVEPSWDYDVDVARSQDDDENKSCHHREREIFSRTLMMIQSGDRSEENISRASNTSVSTTTTILMPTDTTENAMDRRRKGSENTNNHLPSRLRKLRHRISELNHVFITRKEEKMFAEKITCSFDSILVMFLFRFMSRSQLFLEYDCDYDEAQIPCHLRNMELVKVLICHIIRWMNDNKFIRTQGQNFQLPLCSHDNSDDTASVQSQFLYYYSDSNSTDPGIHRNERCLELSDFVAPEYIQSFLKYLDEATDLTPDYIHAHNRNKIHDIESDDDNMSVELNRLHSIETEIKKELLEIDAQHAAELSTDESTERKISMDAKFMDGETPTDAFYNAILAMTSDDCDSSEEDLSSDESSEATFDVQDARETALRLINQIQSQLPQSNAEKAPQGLPLVQQKIMNDLLVLSQKPEPRDPLDPLESCEISIELQASVSSIGLEDHLDPIALKRNDSFDPITLQRSDSIESFTGEKTDPIAIQVDRNEDREAFCSSQGSNAGILKANDVSNTIGRPRKTIWTNLLDIRQKITEKSDRRTPFLQFNKARSPRTTNENSLDADCKYLAHEYIRQSHQNNNSIEVILKDSFKISTTEKSLTQVTSCTDESTTLFSKESLKSKRVATVPQTKTEMVDQDMKTGVFRGIENTSQVNRLESTATDIIFMSDGSSKSTNDYLGDITWSMSPIIDPFNSTPSRTPSLTEFTSATVDFAQHQRVNTASMNGRTGCDSDPIPSATNENILQCAANRKNVKTQITGAKIDSLRKEEERTNCQSPKLFDYWKNLYTHSFSRTFDENIENEPVYVVHSTSGDFNSETISNPMGRKTGSLCESIVKEDPSGHYSIGYYSDENSGSNPRVESDSISQDIKSTLTMSEVHGSKDDRCLKYEEYDPIEAARRIPEVFSENGISLENLDKPKRIEYHLNAGSTIDSAETIFFDTEDMKFCVNVASSHEVIEVSDHLPSLYFSLPSVDYNAE